MHKVIIIGGMAAGCKAAARLSRFSSDFDITIIERRSVISVANCGLNLFAAGDIDNIDELLKTGYGAIRDDKYFKDVKGVTVLLNTEVSTIDVNNCKVDCKNTKNKKTTSLPYDSLLIAIGTKSIEPKFPFPKSSKISSFHSTLDAKKFREAAQLGQVGKAVIIGGGFIGCELIEVLNSLWGIETTLIEKEDHLLSKFLDSEVSKLVVNRIKEYDVKLLLGEEVCKIELNDEGEVTVHLVSGDIIKSDYVFYNLGVKPEVTIAEKAGIEIGECGGIRVDHEMKTNIANIWAAGDCVETKNLVTDKFDLYSLGSLSNRMGRVAANSIASEEAYFDGIVGATSLKLFDMIFSSVGLIEKRATQFKFDVGTVYGCWSDRPDFHPCVKNLYGKLVYEKKTLKLLGIQLIGKGEVNRYLDVFSELLKQKKSAIDLLNIEHGYTPAHSSPLSPLYYLGCMVINQEENKVKNHNPNFLDRFTGLFIDIREQEEVDTYPFEYDAVHIPIDKFRSRIDEIDITKPLMIICQKGQRAYEVGKILVNMGAVDVSYLGGGVLLHNEMTNESLQEV